MGLVICCCKTNCSKIEHLKTTLMYDLIVFGGLESRCGFAGPREDRLLSSCDGAGCCVLWVGPPRSRSLVCPWLEPSFAALPHGSFCGAFPTQQLASSERAGRRARGRELGASSHRRESPSCCWILFTGREVASSSWCSWRLNTVVNARNWALLAVVSDVASYRSTLPFFQFSNRFVIQKD